MAKSKQKFKLKIWDILAILFFVGFLIFFISFIRDFFPYLIIFAIFLIYCLKKPKHYRYKLSTKRKILLAYVLGVLLMLIPSIIKATAIEDTTFFMRILVFLSGAFLAPITLGIFFLIDFWAISALVLYFKKK